MLHFVLVRQTQASYLNNVLLYQPIIYRVDVGEWGEERDIENIHISPQFSLYILPIFSVTSKLRTEMIKLQRVS